MDDETYTADDQHIQGVNMGLNRYDRAEIRDLVDRYAFLVDARDFAGVGALFTPDAQLILPEPPNELSPVRIVSGREAIESELTRLESFAVTFHGVSGQLVDDVAGDGLADGWVNCVAHHVSVSEAGTRDLIWHLRYRDSYQRTDSGWRIARRAIHIELVDSTTIKRANSVPLGERVTLPAR